MGLILLDTSACIEFLRATGSVIDRAVRTLHRSDRFYELALCGPVVMELLMGLPRPPQARLLAEWAGQLRHLETQDPGDFLQAARLHHAARGKGTPVGKPIDCLIAAIAIRHKAQLLHRNRDFDRLAKVAPLRVFDPAWIT